MEGKRLMRTCLQVTVAPLGLMLAVACGPRVAAPFEVTEGTLQMGSLYYAQAGCARCHGSKWDGKSKEAETLRQERGLVVSDFTKMKDPETTPVDYFKAITGGTPKLKSHAYHEYTDSARWAMAHFLYSLASRLSGARGAQREEALARELAEAARAYEQAARLGNRRWEAGFFQPVAERPKAPGLATLLSGVVLAQETARGAPAPGRIRNSHQATGRGKQLYGATCAACHGAFGEGSPSGVGFGLIPCKNGAARCAVTYASRDIRGQGARFGAAHQTAAAGLLPSFSTMAPDDVGAVFEFLGAGQ